MDRQTTLSSEDEYAKVMEKVVKFVAKEAREGVDRSQIAERLVEKGMERDEALKVTNELCDALSKIAQNEKLTPTAVFKGILGSVLAAMICGVVWGFIVKATNYEIGFMAVGVGYICGRGVVLFSGGKKGTLMQIVAVVSSVLGVFVGKYMTFFYMLNDYIKTQQNADVSISMFSGKVISLFVELLPKALSGYDALWVVIAVYTAWSIPKAIGIKAA